MSNITPSPVQICLARASGARPPRSRPRHRRPRPWSVAGPREAAVLGPARNRHRSDRGPWALAMAKNVSMVESVESPNFSDSCSATISNILFQCPKKHQDVHGLELRTFHIFPSWCIWVYLSTSQPHQQVVGLLQISRAWLQGAPAQQFLTRVLQGDGIAIR